MTDNRQIFRSEYQKIKECHILRGEVQVFDYDQGRFLTQEEMCYGIIFDNISSIKSNDEKEDKYRR